MSGNGRQFTSETAPRTGGKAGRRNKLGLEAIKFIEDLYKDYRTHGAAAIAMMRIEKPEAYIRLMADVSTKLVAPDTERVPPMLVVKWLSTPPAPIEGIDKVPMLELQAAEPDGDDDDASPSA
jgi:hypothetical protein